MIKPHCRTSPQFWAALLVVLSACGATMAADRVAEPPISRVLFGSCIKQDQPAPIFETMLQQRPELLIFLGDNIYADTADLELMRAKYARLGSQPLFQQLRSACPVLATWDDHDYGVNDGGADFPQKVGSQQVFLDFWQDPPDSVRRMRPGVYDARVYGPPGQRLQVILLDTRYFRSPLKSGERRLGGPHVPDDSPEKTMLGEDQWNWLKTQLQTPAELRLIVSSIQFLSSDAGHETWANLPRERRRMLQLIDETRARGVFFVSGDRHWSELSVQTADVPYPIYDLTSSSLNQPHPRGTPTNNRYRDRDLPTTYHQANFGQIEIDWNASPTPITLQIRDVDNVVRLEKRLTLESLQREE